MVAAPAGRYATTAPAQTTANTSGATIDLYMEAPPARGVIPTGSCAEKSLRHRRDGLVGRLHDPPPHAGGLGFPGRAGADLEETFEHRVERLAHVAQQRDALFEDDPRCIGFF